MEGKATAVWRERPLLCGGKGHCCMEGKATAVWRERPLLYMLSYAHTFVWYIVKHCTFKKDICADYKQGVGTPNTVPVVLVGCNG